MSRPRPPVTVLHRRLRTGACALLLAGLLAAQPARPATPEEARFDLSVHNAPAAQLFLQLSNQSNWQVLVAPDVAGQVSLTLKDTTVPEVLDTLRELYGYDFRISGRRVLVQPNTAQTRLYRVSYLPGRRQGTSEIRVSSSSISQAGITPGGGGGGGLPQAGSAGGTGSRNDDTAHVRTTSDADFWRDVQSSLNTLLAGSAGAGPNVIINAAAGVIVVRATPAEQRQVEAYLKAVQLGIERQVMLEAKILEVELGESSQTGINWSSFGRALGGAFSIGVLQPGMALRNSGNLGNDALQSVPGSSLSASSTSAGLYGLSFQSTSFAALLNFLETQGKVQVLSSPRIATLNNQKAVLKVGSDELYVTGVSTSITSTANSTSTTTPAVILQPFFSGIALDVTPQIDAEGLVMLHVHPSISNVTEKQKSINLGALGAYQLPLPTSTINETDSIVRVRDGQIVAIGGLMSQQQSREVTGVTGLGSLPLLGGLFRQTSTVLRKRELVILMKPSVIRDDAPWPEADTGTPASQLLPAAEPSTAPSAAPAAR